MSRKSHQHIYQSPLHQERSFLPYAYDKDHEAVLPSQLKGELKKSYLKKPHLFHQRHLPQEELFWQRFCCLEMKGYKFKWSPVII